MRVVCLSCITHSVLQVRDSGEEDTELDEWWWSTVVNSNARGMSLSLSEVLYVAAKIL